MTPEERYIVGLEIGSSQAKIGVAGFDPNDPNGELTVYVSKSLSTVDSVRYGRITNIRDVENVISRLVESVESESPVEGRRVLGVYLNIGGRSLKSVRIGARSILPQRREITDEMVERLEADALATLDSNLEMICTEPLRFSVDNILTPRPVGTLGSRLAGEFTAVVCSPANKSDLQSVVNDRVGLTINGLAVRPVALAHLVLSPSETNAGCMLVDIGAETTTVAIFYKYALHYLVTIPIGSRLITRDLAASLALTEEEAEKLKIAVADARPSSTDDPRVKHVNTVVSARLADLLANIAAQPGFAGFEPERLRGGIILTGGGAKLRNLGRLLESYTHVKVRIATLPPGIVIADTSLAAADNLDLIALLNEAANDARRSSDIECLSPRPKTEPAREIVEEVVDDKSNDDTDSQTVIDFMNDNEARAEREAQAEREHQYGYEASDFDNRAVYENGDDENDNDLLEDDPDDEDLLMDDDKAEQNRRDRDRDRGRQRKRERDRAEKKRRAEEDRRRREEREQDRINNPGRIDKWISRLTGILSRGNDESADLDE